MKVMHYVKKGMKYLFNPRYRFMFNANRGRYNNIPDKVFLEKYYFAAFGKKLNLNNPETFNEKLQWLKLYNQDPMYTVMADKYRVRQCVAEKLGEEYLIPLLGVWEKPEDIDFSQLPSQFVLKCNHNSGSGLIVCKDKAKLDIPKARRELKKCLNENYYLRRREWPYKDIAKKIIAEKFMTEADGSDLKDYKIHCFNGEPKFILVCSERFFESGLCEDFYDTNWNLLNFRRPKHPNSKKGIPKPDKLQKMLELAKILAKDIPFVRIDFYLINQKIYFGEITFFPAAGFEKFVPKEADQMLGEWMKLPAIL